MTGLSLAKPNVKASTIEEPSAIIPSRSNLAGGGCLATGIPTMTSVE